MSSYYQSPKYSVDAKADYEELHDFDPLEIAGHETDYQFNRLDSTPDFRRWSVIDKVKTHYGHYKVKDASECGKFVTSRCLLGILMLVVFISLSVLFVKVILFNFTLGPIEYDFIIVGGGPAGCIIAQKLSSAGAKVLLLEAGSSPQIDIDAAAAASTNIKKFRSTTSVTSNKYNLLNSLNLLETPFLWYSSGDFPDILWEEEEAEEGPTNSDPVLAKGLGGNSLLSAMIYLRALPEDILKWDLSSITWERLFETYRAQEKYIIAINSNGVNSSDSNSTISSSYHGNNGFFGTTDNSNYRDPVSKEFLDSAVRSGLFSLNQDFNNPLTSRKNTIGYYDFNIWDGLRSTVVQQLFQQSPTTKSSSSSTTNNAPSIDALHNNKLTIQLNAKVKKVLLSTLEDIPEGDEERHKAYGVLYELKDGKQYRATLATNTRSLSSLSPGMRTSQPISWKRNVILTAGAVMTPHLLRESGIGSCNSGRTMKICNDMIGTNIQDHPSIYMIMELKDRSSSGNLISISLIFLVSSCHISVVAGIPSAYETTPELVKYLSIVSQLQQLDEKNDIQTRIDMINQLGIMGTSGFSVGGFMTSPFAADPSIPDIQFTLFPSVSLFCHSSLVVVILWVLIVFTGNYVKIFFSENSFKLG
jgi:choline dehydrogenase-like flavoprotein